MARRTADRGPSRARIDDEVVVLFALVPESLARATAALLDQDVERAERVIGDDNAFDERCEQLTSLVSGALSGVRDDPAELEDLAAILQVVSELERSADLAEHIAQRSLQGLGGVINPRSRGLIQSMNDIAVRMWLAAADAYQQRSRDAAFQLGADDDALDALAANLVSTGVAEATDPQVAVDLALIARFYERLGDHAVNLARRVDAMAAPRRLSPLGKREARPRPDGHGLLSRFRGLRLVPTDEGFFDLFNETAANARDCAEELSKLIVSFDDLDGRFERIKACEHRGDQLTIELLRRLDASFVTPFDREDIHALTEVLDDVVDAMFSAGSLVHLVRAEEPLPELTELGGVLLPMSDELVALMASLRDRDAARFRLQRIERMEREGDAIYRRAMEHLFSGEYEPLEVLKWKDVVQAFEEALNAIEDVSEAVESILIKSS